MRNLFLPSMYLTKMKKKNTCGSHISAIIAEAGSPYSAKIKETKQIAVLKHLL